MKVKYSIDQNQQFQPGAYYVGDPCYVYPNSEWGDFCDVMIVDNNTLDGFFEYEGVPFFVGSTRYGDGSYPLIAGRATINTLAVDSGTLSIIPLELIEKWRAKIEHGLSGVVSLNENTGVSHEQGDFEFGHYAIVTSYEQEDEETYGAFFDD